MVIKETPSWARWFIVWGFVIPMLSFVFIKQYDPRESLWWNLMRQETEFTFSKGQNPLVCINESLQRTVGGALGSKVPPSYQCQRYTTVYFRNILFFSMTLMGIGFFGALRGRRLANTHPTEWNPFSEANVRKTGRKQLRIEDAEDRPIKPHEGGF